MERWLGGGERNETPSTCWPDQVPPLKVYSYIRIMKSHKIIPLIKLEDDYFCSSITCHGQINVLIPTSVFCLCFLVHLGGGLWEEPGVTPRSQESCMLVTETSPKQPPFPISILLDSYNTDNCSFLLPNTLSRPALFSSSRSDLSVGWCSRPFVLW